MKHAKPMIMTIATLLVAVGLFGSAAAATKLTVVGTDPEGDWGENTGSSAPAGGPLGQDLVKASIGKAGANLEFVIGVTSLPPNGGVPEGTRYTWQMMVNGEFVELDGKWSNYSRGACDPTGGKCPPPRDPGMQPFLVRGNCASNGAVVACEELGIVQATFDAAAGTITIPVPMKLIKAKPGTKIMSATQADSGFSGISAVPSAYYSHSSAPYDSLVPTKVYTVPKK